MPNQHPAQQARMLHRRQLVLLVPVSIRQTMRRLTRWNSPGEAAQRDCVAPAPDTGCELRMHCYIAVVLRKLPDWYYIRTGTKQKSFPAILCSLRSPCHFDSFRQRYCLETTGFSTCLLYTSDAADE